MNILDLENIPVSKTWSIAYISVYIAFILESSILDEESLLNLDGRSSSFRLDTIYGFKNFMSILNLTKCNI